MLAARSWACYPRRGRPEHGFLLDKGAFTTIDPPGYHIHRGHRDQWSWPYRRASTYMLSGTSMVLLDKGGFTTIDVPVLIRTNALGINAPGQTAGFFTDTGGTVHGFVAH